MSNRLVIRMIAPTLGLSALVFILGLIAAIYVHRLQTSSALLVHKRMATFRASDELEMAIRRTSTQLREYLIYEDPSRLETVPDHVWQIERWLTEIERIADTPQEKELVEELRAGRRFLVEGLAKIDPDIPVEQNAEFLRPFLSEVVKQLQNPASEYSDRSENVALEASARHQLEAKRMMLGLLLLGVCGAVAGILLGYAIARGVNRSIVQLSVPIRDVAGKLNEVLGPVTLSASRDVEALEGNLREIVEQISTVIERLQQSEHDALRAEQLAAVGQFAAGLAHELRNPLMAMKVLVQSTRERSQAARLEGHDLVVLEQEIIRLERSIGSFLDFARPPQVERRQVELREIIDSAVELVDRRAWQQGVALVKLFPEHPVYLQADGEQLRQLVLNLLMNALDVMPRGGTIECELTHRDSPAAASDQAKRLQTDAPQQSWIELGVADTGPGLPDGLGSQIFEPFVSTKETGMGLGLSISKRIAEAHGGTIEATNSAAGGAEFRVFLPALSPLVAAGASNGESVDGLNYGSVLRRIRDGLPASRRR